MEKIKLVVFDFDGVFTDNSVYVDENGNESVRCSRSDGIGLSRLKKAGIATLVISAEKNNVVKKRCEKLEIECISGVKDKLGTLKVILKQRKIEPKNVCFVGNDSPDLECMKYIGFPIAVKDSYPEVLAVAKYTTKAKGGTGAVREVCDNILGGLLD